VSLVEPPCPRDGNFKLLWSSGIDSKESIHVAWRAGTITLYPTRILPHIDCPKNSSTADGCGERWDIGRKYGNRVWRKGRKEGCEWRTGNGLERRKKRGMWEKNGKGIGEKEEKRDVREEWERDWIEGRKEGCERKMTKGLVGRTGKKGIVKKDGKRDWIEGRE
jgi:hypothetical protein